MTKVQSTVAGLLALFACASAIAAGYKERLSGDLSDDGLAPTPLTFSLGGNVVDGKFGTDDKPGGPRTDRDYFTVEVPSGQSLKAIWLDAKTDVGGAYSFIGVQAGAYVTVPPDGNSPAELLGWAHFGSGQEGTDILPVIGAGAGAIGFKPPLGPGRYSFWVQELASCRCRYRFVFEIGVL